MKDTNKQILIIGLGQFGMSLARNLCERGFQVIAVDIDQKLVNEASNFVTDAICLNVIDEVSLSKLSPKDRDIIICSIGSREPSILTVALLKQMGCENIIARASETIHARILKAIGAKHIINPEYEYGKKFANKILMKTIFSEDNTNFELLEIPVKSFIIDENLIEMQFPANFKVTHQENTDKIYISGSKEDIEKLIEENR